MKMRPDGAFDATIAEGCRIDVSAPNPAPIHHDQRRLSEPERMSICNPRPLQHIKPNPDSPI
jgi:hypothetical protein